MMKSRVVKAFKRSLRRSQSGQSLVILALGFVALLGFVGIVTDVSLMFVRFTSLTRAVDAASIAAAGQVRRQVPFPSEVSEHCGPGYTVANPCPEAEAAAFARSFGNIGVAARQFIEFYGLNPQAVLIDMCSTVSTKDPATNTLVSLSPDLEDDFQELCVGPQGRNSDRKLIKVTAQIESPTIFLRLLGFPDIILEASSISETAVLDVVMILDVSESMLAETTPYTWAEQGYSTLYIPPDIGWYNYNYDNVWPPPGRIGFGGVRNDNFADHTGLHDYSDAGAYPAANEDKWYYFRSEVAAQPISQVVDWMLKATPGTVAHSNGPLNNSPFKITAVPHPDAPAATQFLDINARPYCAVAYFPYSRNFRVLSNPVPPGEMNLMELYDAAGHPWTQPNGNWDGFVPGYNYYRCCNDPNNDGLFDDLLCQPFKQMRDATELFLQRIDFLRGDRVAFVTFDRGAYLMRVDVGDGIYSHMIDNEALAISTLQDFIGVRAEPNFYEPTTISGSRGDPEWVTAMPWIGRSQLLGNHDYDAKDNCPFQDAAMEWPWSPSSAPSQAQAAAFGLSWVPAMRASTPNRLTPDSFNPAPDGLGQRMYPRNDTVYPWQTASGYGATRSYDLWGSCRGTNVGAALREGNNALLDPVTTRTSGAVWVMVLLGDGAAGASDPVFDNGPTIPNDLYYPYNDDTTRVQYGGLGLCPTGRSPNGIAELTQFNESPYVFPFCSDEIPETRNFCFNGDIEAAGVGKLYVDLAQCGEARYYYDVDDYARDWADWIGLIDRDHLTVTGDRSLSQLPTIFTIGFRLNFRDGTIRCQQGQIAGGDVGECLGEELLRYIADVGDNFRIDTDYQQALIAGEPLTAEEYGPRGECEDPADPGVILPKRAGTSCGNYYNAPGGDELNRVFDDIASRMFTRLTQ